MADRNIELDNANLAIPQLPCGHKTIESFLDGLEASQWIVLPAQRDRPERFCEGRFTPWREVKRQNGL